MFLRRLLATLVVFSYVTQTFAQSLGDRPGNLDPRAGNKFDLTGGDPGTAGRAGEYRAGYYPGAIMMPINLWGATKTAGLFKVPKNTTLIELLSYAQGPTDQAKLNSIQIKRTSEKTEHTFVVDVEELIKNPAAHDITLMPNDVVYVTPRRPLVDPSTVVLIGLISTILTGILTAVVISDKTK